MIAVGLANMDDVPAIKVLADRHKHELGFVRRPALEDAQRRGRLYVAWWSGVLVGFAECWHRRDGQTTIYAIAVEREYRRRGVGSELIRAIAESNPSCIAAKCPVDLPSNRWYAAMGFRATMERGKKRHLNVWRLEIPLPRGADTCNPMN